MPISSRWYLVYGEKVSCEFMVVEKGIGGARNYPQSHLILASLALRWSDLVCWIHQSADDICISGPCGQFHFCESSH